MKTIIPAFLVILLMGGVHSLNAQGDSKITAHLQSLRIQDEEQIRAAPSARFERGGGNPVPNVELPAHIQAKDGELTLFSDFENAGEQGVPLYLVNRTSKAVGLNVQDRDLYFKLEFQDERGGWVRAQTHVFSGCGNSYDVVNLLPGQHIRFFGYRAAEGKPVKVRYRRAQAPMIVSNIGNGFVNATDIAAASFDDLTKHDVSRTLGNVFRQPESNPREYAAALRLLSHYHENAFHRREAKRYLSEVDSKSQVAASITAILESQWPVEKSPVSLYKFALAAIAGENQPGVEDLKGFPELAWGVIHDLLMERVSERRDPVWDDLTKRTYEMLRKVLQNANGGQASAVASILGVTISTDEYVGTAELLGWLEHKDPAVVTVCANALSRRSKWEAMVEKGMTLSLDAQIIILKAMASGGFPDSRSCRDPEGKQEIGFWKHCAVNQPVETVSALYYIGLINGGNGFNMLLHQPLRDFLEKEADLLEKDPMAVANVKHGYPVSQVVSFVGTWKRKDDIPLFKRLLKHPGYQSSTLTDSENRKFDCRRLRVREDAKMVLMSMGVFVGDDVVLEERTPLPPDHPIK